MRTKRDLEMYKPEQSRGYDFLAACFSSDGRLLACFPVLTIKEFNKWADENPMYACRLYQARSFDLTSKFDAKQISIFDAIGDL